VTAPHTHHAPQIATLLDPTLTQGNFVGPLSPAANRDVKFRAQSGDKEILTFSPVRQADAGGNFRVLM
jgi:hypothetical protein